MTDKKREEIKYLAFCQAGFGRIHVLNGEIAKIQAEIYTHKKEEVNWDENSERIEEFAKRSIHIEYLKTLENAYKMQMDALKIELEI